MSALIAEDEIVHEVDFVWLEDVSGLDYVRQSLDRLPTRRGKPAYHRDGRMVGAGAVAHRSGRTGVARADARSVFRSLPERPAGCRGVGSADQ